MFPACSGAGTQVPTHRQQSIKARVNSYSWHSKECIPQALKAATWRSLESLQQGGEYNAQKNDACEEVSTGTSHRALQVIREYELTEPSAASIGTSGMRPRATRQSGPGRFNSKVLGRDDAARTVSFRKLWTSVWSKTVLITARLPHMCAFNLTCTATKQHYKQVRSVLWHAQSSATCGCLSVRRTQALQWLQC